MVEEHSNPPQQQQQQLLLHQQPGTKVWAKLKGYPWWPGQVAEEAAMPKTATPSRRVPSAVPILFYGSNDYAWLHSAELKLFDEGNAPDTPKKQAGKLLEAIKLAKQDADPTGRPPSIAQDSFSEENGEYIGGEEDDEDTRKSSKVRRASASKELQGKATPKSRKAPRTPRAPKTPVSAPASKTPKRKISGATSSSKRKKSQHDDDKKPKGMRQSAADSAMNQPKKVNKELKKHRSPFEHLMYLRHRIQKMMKEDPEMFGSSERMEASMQEIENFTMTIDLLKETKVGKLMKKVTQMDIDPDPNNVKERAGVLIRKWKNDFHLDKDGEQTRGSADIRAYADDHPESDDKPSSAGDGEEDGHANSNAEKPDCNGEVNGNGNAAAESDVEVELAEAKDTSEEVPSAGANAEMSEPVGELAGVQDADVCPQQEEGAADTNGQEEEMATVD